MNCNIPEGTSGVQDKQYLFLGIACLILNYGIQMEKLKETCDIQIYKEIVAFMEGKRPYQVVLCMLRSGIITFILCMLIYAFLHWI